MSMDPVLTGGAKLVDSLQKLWIAALAFLWAMAAAGAAIFGILAAVAWLGGGGASAIFAGYTLAALVWTVVFVIVAIARTIDGRRRPTLHLIGNEIDSYWGRSHGPAGEEGTAINIHLSATNISRGQIRMPVARLLRPRFWHRQEVRAATFDSMSNEYRFDVPPMGPNGVRRIHFLFLLDRPVGTRGRPLKTVVAVSDQRGNWTKYKFKRLRAAPE
jgi:hypothetical protein